MVVVFIYFFYNSDFYWLGFILMFIMYGVIYFIGVWVVVSKKGKLDDMFVVGRFMLLWILMFIMIVIWVGGGYIVGMVEIVYFLGLIWI